MNLKKLPQPERSEEEQKEREEKFDKEIHKFIKEISVSPDIKNSWNELVLDQESVYQEWYNNFKNMIKTENPEIQLNDEIIIEFVVSIGANELSLDDLNTMQPEDILFYSLTIAELYDEDDLIREFLDLHLHKKESEDLFDTVKNIYKPLKT